MCCTAQILGKAPTGRLQIGKAVKAVEFN